MAVFRCASCGKKMDISQSSYAANKYCTACTKKQLKSMKPEKGIEDLCFWGPNTFKPCMSK